MFYLIFVCQSNPFLLLRALAICIPFQRNMKEVLQLLLQVPRKLLQAVQTSLSKGTKLRHHDLVCICIPENSTLKDNESGFDDIHRLCKWLWLLKVGDKAQMCWVLLLVQSMTKYQVQSSTHRNTPLRHVSWCSLNELLQWIEVWWSKSKTEDREYNVSLRIWLSCEVIWIVVSILLREFEPGFSVGWLSLLPFLVFHSLLVWSSFEGFWLVGSQFFPVLPFFLFLPRFWSSFEFVK